MREKLSRRERQIIDCIYERGRATAEDVRADLGEDLSNSTVRTLLSILEEKGLVRHEAEGKRYVYVPTIPAAEAGIEALRKVVKTFFADSATNAMAAFIEAADARLTDGEFDRLAALIEAAKAEKR
ncbi:MAG TPA: BlaI/MecI/CopY family transcriptional regulator [Rectinemataceae bacterium]|nr:BlaI/MecI/CopY family transcriptional regulator [Rectinemataceae bacterium]